MSIIHWPLDKWLDNVALAALSSKDTLYATFDLARQLIARNIPGDFVECGVFGGAQCAVMARAIMEAYPVRPPFPDWPPRRVHLFDSFQGIPAAGEHDKQFHAAGHEAGVSICTLEAVKQHMEEWGIPDELLVYHPGWFDETIPHAGETFAADGRQIALLRLDADLYNSTRVALTCFYPRLSVGGWCIIDDYGLDGCRKAVEEYMQGNYPPVYWRKA